VQYDSPGFDNRSDRSDTAALRGDDNRRIDTES
jgi:hypothetical protein